MDWADEDASSTKRTGSGFQLSRLRWSMEMEYLIVDLWEENIDDYYGPRKRTLVYKDIADRITAEGLEVSWTDVRNKIENLTRKYRQEKDKVTANDGSPSQWPHFEKIHSLLNSDRKLVRPSQLPKAKKIKVEDNSESFFEEPEIEMDTQTELLTIAREQLQIQRQEQIFNREHRRAQMKVLKYIARSQNRLHSLLVQLLTDTNDDDDD